MSLQVQTVTWRIGEAVTPANGTRELLSGSDNLFAFFLQRGDVELGWVRSGRDELGPFIPFMHDLQTEQTHAVQRVEVAGNPYVSTTSGGRKHFFRELTEGQVAVESAAGRSGAIILGHMSRLLDEHVGAPSPALAERIETARLATYPHDFID
jgi:hypothetical protein